MRLFIYILLAMPSFVAAAIVWDHIAVDKLFYCSDSCGPFDFIPPFVHSVAGDHYIGAAWFVWLLWAALLTVALALPVVAITACYWIYEYVHRHEVQG